MMNISFFSADFLPLLFTGEFSPFVSNWQSPKFCIDVSAWKTSKTIISLNKEENRKPLHGKTNEWQSFKKLIQFSVTLAKQSGT